MQEWHLGLLRMTAAWVLAAGLSPASAQVGAGGAAGSVHHTEAGFFDIHVCNWPNQPVFLMALFSTTRYKEIGEIEVFDPGNRSLGRLDLRRYRLVLNPGKPEKRVFIANIAVPDKAADGWYSARITMRAGETFSARDYVALGRLPRAGDLIPADGAENVTLPKELKWNAVPGAKYYQVFVKDLWDGERLILTSTMLDKPRLALPPGLLQPGGAYSWRVHARDVNEDPKLGDFNLGSLSAEVKFSVAP
ncbi:MAG: hypothetical protein IH604_12660 [Burkholderiales bacterium]|nr:hypothetical protein [Burkholderiales bacterium]